MDVSFAPIGVIVGEFIGAERGLGKLIIEAEARASAAEMMVPGTLGERLCSAS